MPWIRVITTSGLRQTVPYLLGRLLARSSCWTSTSNPLQLLLTFWVDSPQTTGRRRAFELALLFSARGNFAALYGRVIVDYPSRRPPQKNRSRTESQCLPPLPHRRTCLHVDRLRDSFRATRRHLLTHVGHCFVDSIRVMECSPPLAMWSEIYCHPTSVAPR